MGAGHASTSIGYAVGIKEGMRRLGGEQAEGAERRDGKVVAVIGDGAMTGGVAFEAIGQAGGLGTPMVVVLNDNGMSIAPNVGALSRYFNRVRLNPKLWHARAEVEGGLTRLPGGIGSAFERLGPQLKESIKAFWAPGLWWEELDWAYMGVVDGHDVRSLREALREAIAAERPVVVHIATVKGKGFAPAEDGGLEGMEKWHAAKPKSIVNGVPASAAPRKDRMTSKPSKAPAPQYTQVFGEALVRECERDERVVGITAAMNSGTGLSILQKAMPERYFDVGIAEQQAILFAVGPGARGRKAGCRDLLDLPAARVRPDRARRLPAAAERRVRDGPSRSRRRRRPDASRRVRHRLPALPAEHGADGAARRGDAREHAAHGADCFDGPIAMRYPRGEGTGIALPDEPQPIAIGTGEILREGGASEAAGRRVALIGYGSGVGKALEAADRLASAEISPTVVDARFAKPIDAGLMAQLAAEHDLLVTVEEGVLAGGFGSAVWETLSRPARDHRGSCASACPTVTSRTASRRSCTRRSASRRSASQNASPLRSPTGGIRRRALARRRSRPRSAPAARTDSLRPLRQPDGFEGFVRVGVHLHTGLLAATDREHLRVQHVDRQAGCLGATALAKDAHDLVAAGVV